MGDSTASTSGLGHLVAGLRYLAGGRPHQARYWLSKVGEEGKEPWLVCLSYLAEENTEYLGGAIDAQSGFAQKAENVAGKMNDNELLAFSLRYIEYVSYIHGDLAKVEHAVKTDRQNFALRNNWIGGAPQHCAGYPITPADAATSKKRWSMRDGHLKLRNPHWNRAELRPR